ncbi:MAG: nickel-dependent hydrogenase large subunit [Candidatus Ratteibacteria bacterium]
MSKKRTVSVPLGPYHPLFEEPEFFNLYCDGERVVDVEWKAGYNHRGIEKLSEGKHWDQVIFLVERICGICSTSHPFAYVNAVENLAGIEIPDRVRYIRSLVGELERIHSHLLWLGLAGHFLGYNTVFMWAWKYREPILDLFEEISGSRQNYAMMKIGGVRRDIPIAKIPLIEKSIADLSPKLEMLSSAILDDPVLSARLKGVGILSKEDISLFGAIGPVARASGVAIDVRKDFPYAAYGMVDWKVITREEGDVLAKAMVRLEECMESIHIIRQCLLGLKRVPEGNIGVEVRDIPGGEGIGRHEAPRGECFHYVKSDGSNQPVRHKIRAPSFMNVPTFMASCVGHTLSDVTIILAGVDPCYCCTERMIRLFDLQRHSLSVSDSSLLERSRQKTRSIAAQLGRKKVWK